MTSDLTCACSGCDALATTREHYTFSCAGERWENRLSMYRASALVFATFILAACASAPRPGTGDLSFRVSWTGKADIDLYVESPLDESINYAITRAPSGGQLDIDCNYHGVRMCDAPMENIFWPRGGAPHGSYRFWILLVDPGGLQEDDRYTLEVRRGRRVTWSTSGRVADLANRIPHHSFEFPSGVIETIAPEDRDEGRSH